MSEPEKPTSYQAIQVMMFELHPERALLGSQWLRNFMQKHNMSWEDIEKQLGFKSEEPTIPLPHDTSDQI